MATFMRTVRISRRGLAPATIAARRVHIAATPSITSISGLVDLSKQTRAIPKLSGTGPFPAECTFEILGTPHSMLSVSLPASSNLYTRRGTLLGLNGRPSDTTSTLSLLSPLRRIPQGIPFLYQKITSTSPLTCLISTNTPNTTFCVLSLDGTADWTITQPDALLAWSGHSLVMKPREVMGRGLVALIGRGQVYQLQLKEGEEFIIHDRSLLAYSAAGQHPTTQRLAMTQMRFQIPYINFSLQEQLGKVDLVQQIRASGAWKAAAKAWWKLKVAVQGDRQFRKFYGPVTILLQSRTGNRWKDMISKEEVGELADLETGALARQFKAPAPAPTPAPAAIKTAVNKATPVAHKATEVAKDALIEGKGKVEDLVEKVVAEDKASTKSAETVVVRRSHAGTLKRVIVKDGKVEFEDSDFSEFRK
ncbi:mitochondrial biogenesis AIM24-domain-containing protein [Pyronema omphalodes]|nr:mitochondrial biogenesis AIM24-domain-containing protein [Pyronema omphalodes]